jgi:hypothetical protein
MIELDRDRAERLADALMAAVVAHYGDGEPSETSEANHHYEALNALANIVGCIIISIRMNRSAAIDFFMDAISQSVHEANVLLKKDRAADA